MGATNGPAEVMAALSHGWWKGWRGPKPLTDLTDEFRDRGRGFNVLSVSGRNAQTEAMDTLLRLIRDVPGSIDYLRHHAA